MYPLLCPLLVAASLARHNPNRPSHRLGLIYTPSDEPEVPCESRTHCPGLPSATSPP